MLRIVAWLSSMAAGTSLRSLRISTMSADSIATSVPAPIASPTSARTSAGASLMPSPTIATFRPSSCRRRTSRSLSCGSTSATTRSTPTCRPIASAVRALSPVSMTTSSPIALMPAMASRLVGLTVSATAITPSRRPSAAKNSGVFPSPANRSRTCSTGAISMPDAAIIAALPPKHSLPSTTPRTPWPGTCSNPSAFGTVRPRRSPSATMALASGCSDGRSSAAATRSRSSTATSAR